MKSINLLVIRLQENLDGTLKGGFADIKGGFGLMRKPTTNASPNVCSGTNNNPSGCTNSYDCSASTNKGNGGCSNTGVCFY